MALTDNLVWDHRFNNNDTPNVGGTDIVKTGAIYTAVGAEVLLGSHALDQDGINDETDMGITLTTTYDGDFTQGIWFRADDGNPASLELIFGVREAAGDDNRVRLFINTDGTVGFAYSPQSGGNVSVSHGTLLSDGQQGYHLVIFGVDTGTGELFINVDDGTEARQSYGANDPANFSGSINPYLGCENVGGTAVFFFAGQIDQTSIWDAVKSGADQTAFYNSGAGTEITVTADAVPPFRRRIEGY